MSILDKVKIGNSVQINLELSKDRLNKETIDAINVSSLGKISDFRITDGKGIGVVLQLSNGKEQWFFEDEIDLLDENGNVIKKNNEKKENSNFIFDFLRGLNYENKNKNIKATNAKIDWEKNPNKINQNNMCICTICNSPTPEGEIKRWGKCSFCWRKIKN